MNPFLHCPLVVDRYRLHDKYPLLLLSLDGLMCAWVLWRSVVPRSFMMAFVLPSAVVPLLFRSEYYYCYCRHAIFCVRSMTPLYILLARDTVHNIMLADVSHLIFYWFAGGLPGSSIILIMLRHAVTLSYIDRSLFYLRRLVYDASSSSASQLYWGGGS